LLRKKLALSYLQYAMRVILRANFPEGVTSATRSWDVAIKYPGLEQVRLAVVVSINFTDPTELTIVLFD